MKDRDCGYGKAGNDEMKRITAFLINLYKKYGYLFQGKLFSIVILFYKENRVAKTPLQALKKVLSHFGKIRVYGGSRSREKVLEKASFDADGCCNFIYTWDVYKSVKIRGRILGNCTVDYRKILNCGLSHYYMEGDDVFAKANNSLLDAILAYVERLAAYVEESEIDNRENIVSYLARFRNEPAQNLEEALQRILVVNQIQWQLGHILVGLGRLDYYLDRFAEEERKAKRLFKEFFSLLHKYYTIKSNALMGDTGQIVILGGRDEEGDCFTNKYTEWMIEVMQELQLPDPKVLLRVNKDMEDGVWENIIHTMSASTGSPLISNDDEIIQHMTAFGYGREDANNYITSACWEPIAGNCYEQNNILSLNYLEPFERISRKHDLKKIDSFDRLMELYYEELRGYIEDITGYLDTLKWEKDPFYSMFDENARRSRKDVSAGGSKYNNYGILTVALANAVDSLENIREVVFEKKLYTYEEMDVFRRDNFKNHDAVYQLLKHMDKKWGHDGEEVCGFVNRITEKTQYFLEAYQNPLGGGVKFGLSSPHYIMDSVGYPASFDGRKKGEPFSVHISSGRGIAYTELMNFASKLNYTGKRFNGNVVDFMVSPALIKQNMGQFVKLIKVSLLQGCCQLQANVIDAATLARAKNSPEEFPNLIVRVWGFNAYFNELPEEYKDYLIERARQSEAAFD